jgi:hypothetical protein
LVLRDRQIFCVGSQYCVAAQGWLGPQPPEHDVLSAQRFDVQATPVTVVHAPEPLQVDATLAIPAEQFAGVHCFSVPG